jgi:hypothetical protein
MFPTSEWGPAVDQTTASPPCPNCGKSMHSDWAAQRTGDHSDKHGECRVAEEETSDTIGGFLPRLFGARWRGG